jgi:predicted deacylase
MVRPNVKAIIACAIGWCVAVPTAYAGRDPFHDVTSLNARVRALHDDHPTTTRIVTVATTASGDVVSLEIDPLGLFDPAAPVLILQGGVHGSEWISTEVVLRLAEFVLGVEPTRWQGLTYRFIPAASIEGFAAGTRTAPDATGEPYDPNREFPVPGQPDHASQPPMQALRDYAKTGHVVAVLDYHSDAECMLWPWAYSGDVQPPDAQAIAAVSAAMGAAVGHCSGQVAKVISYKHQGTAADWYQDALGAPTILVELGPVDLPGSASVAQVLIDQERPFAIFVDWLEQRGVKSPAPAPAAGCQTANLTLGRGPLGYTATGQVCDGQRTGAWHYTARKGKRLREGEYRHGLMHGVWRTFHPGGGKQDRVTFVDGTPDGTLTRLAANGKQVMERSFDRGVRSGTMLLWTDAGQLWRVRECGNGGLCTTVCKAGGKKKCKRPEAIAAGASSKKPSGS